MLSSFKPRAGKTIRRELWMGAPAHREGGSSLVGSCLHTSIAAVLLTALAVGCGHSAQVMDAYEDAKKGITGPDVGPGGTGSAWDEEIPATNFDCSAAPTQQFDTRVMKPFELPEDIAAEVDSTLAAMGPNEKALQMMGVDGSERNYRDIERSQDVDVPGVGTIRGFRYRDAGRGVNLDAGQDNRHDDGHNFATAFPTPSTRAASWDLVLERRVGAAIGDETVASKNNMLLAPCMNIIRHPYWGRTGETYGEDTYHTGRMAAAFAAGIQEYVIACAKHYAGNNIEDGRATQNAVMTEQTLREIYGRHFEMVVQDSAAGCIMAAYNLVNGEKSTQNRHLLRDILKAPVEQGGFGFQGLVLTDWWAMPGDQEPRSADVAQSETIQAVNAGTDVEVPWTLHYTEATLANADPSLVEDAARRVLTQKYLFNTAKTDSPWGLKPAKSVLGTGEYDGSIVANLDHEALAVETELKSAVLLTNGLGGAPVLPITDPAIANIAVVGPVQDFKQISSSVPKSCGSTEGDVGQGQTATRECTFHFATEPALGDRGSSRVNGDPARAVSPFQAVQATAEGRNVWSGTTAAEAQGAQAVVVVVGYTPGDEGEEYYIAEGGDRSSLDLPPGHADLVSQVLDLQLPTVILVESGSIVNLPWLDHANRNQATIWAGYPGNNGTLALGQLIFGQANFSGKMPLAWPSQAELDHVGSNGAPILPFKETETVTNMGYYFGYREYDRRKYIEGRTDVGLVFPFGHGLSYSTFTYSNLSVPCQTVTKEAIFAVTIDIANDSDRDGDEVAMLFMKPPTRPAGITGERPWKELKSFTRVTVPARSTVTAELPVRVRDLRRWEGDANGGWVIDSGAYTIAVGKNAEDAETTANVGTVTVQGD